MVDFRPFLNKTQYEIDRWWKKRGDDQANDHYPTLRASELGGPCDRALWYKYNWCKPAERFSGRMYRLFDRGQREEERLVLALKGIGVDVYDDQRRVEALNGRFSGHIDGIGLGVPEAPKTPHLLEFKTHSNKSFKDLCKKGSVEKAKFQHYVQMQIYMHLLGLERGLYISINKDNDEIYCERIKASKRFAKAQLLRAQRIIEAEDPPDIL